MFVDINNLDNGLTLGKLRELVNTGKLSEFPDNTPITLGCREDEASTVVSILADDESITFYNYL